MICTICNRPIKRAGRTMHVSCVESSTDRPTIRWPGGRECSFCHRTDVTTKNGASFCPDHYPADNVNAGVRVRRLTSAPERCPRCGEALTPGVTSTATKCRCDQPMMPRHLRGADGDDQPPAQVRYGN